MTMGQNTMPSYARQITAIERWAIIDYVRALQRSQAPTAEDLATSGGAIGKAGDLSTTSGAVRKPSNAK